MPIDEDIDAVIDDFYYWTTAIVTGGGTYWLLSKVEVTHDISFVIALFVTLITITKVER